MQKITELCNYNYAQGCCELAFARERVRIWFLTDDIIRVRCSFDESFAPELSYALVMTAWEDAADDLLGAERVRVVPAHFKVELEGDYLLLRGAKLTVSVNKQNFAVNILDASERLLHSDMAGKAYIKKSGGQIVHTVRRGDSDSYYGFGEKAGLLNKLHRRMRMHNVDTYDYDAEKTDPLYKHIPFYIKLDNSSSVAHGMYYNNSWTSEFDVGAEHSNYWGKQTSFSADGGELDWFFINGPDIPAIIERYTDLTGKTVMPPRYSLGYLGSTMYYTELDEDSDAAILGFVQRAGAEGIPCDGFHMSSGYSTGDSGKRYVFNWNNKRVRNPKQFIADGLALGAEMVPNIKPGMLTSHPYFAEFSARDAYIRNSADDGVSIDRFWGGNAGFVDFTGEAGRAIWFEKLKRDYIDYGITAIWNDNCEYEINDSDSICAAEGLTGKVSAYRPLMPTLMGLMAQRAVRSARPDKRPFVVNRAGFAGIQRYASTWSGDNGTSWHNLKYGVPIMLGMSLSGVANQGSDIGGFAGPAPEPELFVRWVQHGVLQPRFCIHSCNNDNTVTEPWMYPRYTSYIRAAIKLRYRLVPYLYSLMHEAATTGAPVARPYLYEFQGDVSARDESFSYLLGSSLLVACVLEKGATRRELYLPKGSEWIEWDTMQRYAGGQTIIVDAALDKIPLFIRSGAIIPLTDGIMSLNKQDITCLDSIIEPSVPSQFVLYEDDGVSNAWEQGEYAETLISTQAEGNCLDIDCARRGSYVSTVERLQLQLICPERAPLYIAVSGTALKMYIDDRAFSGAQSGFWFNPETRCVLVKFANPKGDFTVQVRFDAKDLISID